MLHSITPEQFNEILRARAARIRKRNRKLTSEKNHNYFPDPSFPAGGTPPEAAPDAPTESKHLIYKLAHLHREKESARMGEDGITPLSAPEDRGTAKTPSKRAFSPKIEDILTKRGQNIQFSQALKRALIHFCPESSLIHSYTNSLSCALLIKKEGTGITSSYCKSRWCNVCNRIRTGKLLNDYERQIQELKNPYFGTLTIKNCPENELRATCRALLSFWGKWIDREQKRRQRAGNEKIKGYRKLEITHNPETGEFHPHIHFIVEGKKAGLRIIHDWIEENPEKVSIYGQDLQKCDTGTAKELFKYVTKLLPKRKTVNGITQSWESYFTDHAALKTFIKGLDAINRGSQQIRTFQSFGFTKKVQEKHLPELEDLRETPETGPDEPEKPEEFNDLTGQKFEKIEALEDGIYQYVSSQNTWINHDSGEILSHNRPIPSNLKRLIQLLARNIPEPEPRDKLREQVNKYFFAKSGKFDRFG